MKFKDRIKEFRRVPVTELSPNPRNWRTHPPEQKAALESVLSEIGFAGAVLARETPEGLEIIDGHLRAETLDQDVPTLILDVTEAEANTILATYDPLGAMAGADNDALASLLDSIDTDCEALRDLIDEMGSDLPDDEPDDEPELDDVEPQNDRADELAEQWRTAEGQLWIIEGKQTHRLLCGDSTKAEDVGRLMDGAKINLAFTSPPYASQRKYDESSGFKPIHPDKFVDWFAPIAANVKSHLASDGSWFVNIKPACEGLSRLLYVFDLVLSHVRNWGWNFAEEYCWERTGIPQQVARRFKNQFEPIYHFTLGDWKFRPKSVMHESDGVPLPKGKGAGDTNAAKRQGVVSAVDGNEVVAGMAYPGNRLPKFQSEALGHSAAFPVGLPSFFIKAYTDELDSVYEPFCGSGSTLIAGEQLNRKCFGMEISPKYCAVILQRMQDAGCKCEQAK